MFRKSLMSVVACGFSILSSHAGATDYCFNGSVSEAWDNSSNWTPSGVPGSSDKATIPCASPTGSTCTISSGNVTVTTLIVEESGFLNITGRTLTLTGSGASASTTKGGIYLKGADPALTVNGLLKFLKRSDASVPFLYIIVNNNSNATIDGSGTINAREDDAGAGFVWASIIFSDTVADDTMQLTIGSSVTLVGSYILWNDANGEDSDVYKVRHLGTIKVDDADDLFYLGWYDVRPVEWSGTGIVEATAGTIWFDKMTHTTNTDSMAYLCTGGDVYFDSLATGFDDTSDTFTISSGGELASQTDLCTTGALSWGNGTIEAVYDTAQVSIKFAATCP